MGQKISITVVEDDFAFRQNVLQMVLQTPDLECLHDFGSITAFMAAEGFITTDIYWIDINLPEGSGIDLIRHLRSKNADVRCLVCSLHDDDQHIFEAMRAGAGGYLLKSASIDQMIRAIHELMDGGAPMSPYIARRLMDSFREPTKNKDRESFHGLSERELEVLQNIAKGLLYKEVADKLGISIETVKKHLRSIYAKLQVQNRTEAVVKFLNRL